MSDVSNKPLDKNAIIERLKQEGFFKHPDFLPDDDTLRDWMDNEIVNTIKAASSSQKEFLDGCLYVVMLSEKIKVPLPHLKKKAGELLLDQATSTALDIVNPDMCDLAQVYFKEINEQELWVKAHAKAQEGFPMLFENSEALRRIDDELLDCKNDPDEIIARYLQEIINLMDLFSMIDPIYVAKQVKDYFADYKPNSEKVRNALMDFQDEKVEFEHLRKVVGNANDRTVSD